MGRYATILDATAEFMDLGGQPFGLASETLDNETRELRIKLLTEEMGEYLKAEADRDLVEVADGLLDIVVIAWGTLLTYFGEEASTDAATEVWRSNLAKVDGPGLPIRRADGKILKPEGWKPPDIEGVLRKHGIIE